MRHRDAKTRTPEHYERLLEDKLGPGVRASPALSPTDAADLRSGASGRQAPTPSGWSAAFRQAR